MAANDWTKMTELLSSTNQQAPILYLELVLSCLETLFLSALDAFLHSFNMERMFLLIETLKKGEPGTDGGYDARVLERLRNYVSNEPITSPNDDANGPGGQSSPSNHEAAISVPAPPQKLPLVLMPLLPAAMLFPFLSIILQTLPVAQEGTPTTTPDLL
ncbi:hypothetical protein Tco_0242825 [Tanacetum coccineum]